MPAESPKLPWWRRWFGTRSERAGVRYLKKLGYRILAKNVRGPRGELDVVALDGMTLVFVEVRSTEHENTERPAASVGSEKQRRLTELALAYLKRHRLLDHAARFDVLAIGWPANRKEPAIQHFPNAFEAVGRFQMHS
jgi:putative endonuclease